MGCKVNTYDTSLLEKQLKGSGYWQSQDQPLVRIINSCAVTEKSSLETQKLVRKIKTKSPDSVVVITGCVAQVDMERLANQTGADLIIGNSHKGQLPDIVKSYVTGENHQRIFHSNIFKKEALDEGGGIESSRTRAFLKIQDGCNSFCSFCIIPFARGKSRSLPADHLVSRVRQLEEQGFQEVVLTGVHCGDYKDGEIDYSKLVEKVLKETTIPRIRLSSLEPIEIPDSLWELFKTQPRLCSHIHMSLQSANSTVLKNMRRKYSQQEVALFFSKMEECIPQGYIGMDVIAGFPGETDEEFEDAYEFLKGKPWTRMHVFPYSIRPGTLAAKREDHLPSNVIHHRAQRLRELSRKHQEARAHLQVGTEKKVLILEKPSYGAQGLSRDYWPIKIEGLDPSFENTEIPVKITGCFPGPNKEFILSGAIIA